MILYLNTSFKIRTSLNYYYIIIRFVNYNLTQQINVKIYNYINPVKKFYSMLIK